MQHKARGTFMNGSNCICAKLNEAFFYVGIKLQDGYLNILLSVTGIYPGQNTHTPRAGQLRYFYIFKLHWKMLFFLLLLIEFDRGVGYFNGLGPEMAYFYDEIGLEVTFWITLQNRKHQTPSSAYTPAAVGIRFESSAPVFVFAELTRRRTILKLLFSAASPCPWPLLKNFDVMHVYSRPPGHHFPRLHNFWFYPRQTTATIIYELGERSRIFFKRQKILDFFNFSRKVVIKRANFIF